MTVSDLLKLPGIRLEAGESGVGREVCGCYIGDLLSRVLSRAKKHGAWITIMPNVNVAAVALLADVSCVILAEEVVPDKQLSERCETEGIPLLRAEEDAFSIACRLKDLL